MWRLLAFRRVLKLDRRQPNGCAPQPTKTHSRRPTRDAFFREADLNELAMTSRMRSPQTTLPFTHAKVPKLAGASSPLAVLYLSPWLGLLAAACGAATALDFDPPTKDAPAAEPQAKPETESPPPSKPGNHPKPGGHNDGKPGLDLPSFELPECRLGAKPNTVPTCPFLAGGLCYDDVESACACICSREVETLCLEGLFLNEWSGIDVSCTER